MTSSAFDKASTDNERNAMVMELADGTQISCVQVAGLIARRILCYVKPGERLARGQRYGFIRFGSRVDVYLPTLAADKVNVGADARILLDAFPDRPIPAKVSFLASQAQFTPKMVETKNDRDKLMFRIRVRIESLSRIKMFNKAQDSTITPGSFVLAKIEPGAWRAKKGVVNQISALPGLVGIVSQTPVPIGLLVDWVYGSGARTKHFKTMASYFAKEMQRLVADYGSVSNIPVKEKGAAKYRSDNEMTIMVGYAHEPYMTQVLSESNSCFLRDTTAPLEKNLKGTNKDNKQIVENRYMMELNGVQWTNTEDDPPGYVADENRLVRFILNVPFWKETVDRLEIRSPTAWRASPRCLTVGISLNAISSDATSMLWM